MLEPVDNKVHKTICGGEELIESADSGVNTTILEIWCGISLDSSENGFEMRFEKVHCILFSPDRVANCKLKLVYSKVVLLIRRQ